MIEVVVFIKMPDDTGFLPHHISFFVERLLNVCRDVKYLVTNGFYSFVQQFNNILYEMRNVVMTDGVESPDATHFSIASSVVSVYDICGVR